MEAQTTTPNEAKRCELNELSCYKRRGIMWKDVAPLTLYGLLPRVPHITTFLCPVAAPLHDHQVASHLSSNLP